MEHKSYNHECFDSDSFFTNPNVKAELERRCCKRTEVLKAAQYKDRLIHIQELNPVLTKEDIIRLCDLTQEPSIKMPDGLSREQRREWAASVASLYSTLGD